MKKMMLAIAGMLLMTASLSAQEKKSGAIQFENVVDPAVMAEANGVTMSPEMVARMQRSKTPYELLFNATHASYMKVEEVEDSNSEGAGNARNFRFGGGGSNRDYFYQFADRKLTAVFDMNDTTYFMDVTLGKEMNLMMGNRNSGIPVVEYIKSDETKKILGYNCQKVTVKSTVKRKFQDVEREIVTENVIWFTKELGFDFSPNPALWTEGAVLAIESKGNSTNATSIELRKVNAKDTMLPKKGTVITVEEFQAKMEKMMRNMRQRQGNRTGS